MNNVLFLDFQFVYSQLPIGFTDQSVSFIIWLIVIFVLFVFASYFLSFVFSFFKAIISFFKEVFETEKETVGKAKIKHVSAKKYAEESLKTIGKELGKAEKARKQKKQQPKLDLSLSTLAGIADSLLQGLGKVLKK